MRVLPFLLCVCLFAVPALRAQPDHEVVRVTVTYQEPDPLSPWQNRRPETREGYAVNIGGPRFLTTEGLVRNARLVEVSREASGSRITARVELADCHVNLAILTIADPALHGEKKIRPAARIPDETQVRIMQFDATQRVQEGQGYTLGLDIRPLPRAPYPVLTSLVLTDLNINGDGAPVFIDGGLAGVIMAYSRSERTAHMVPGPVICQFLEDALSLPYDGFASAGFVWKPLVDPVKRAYLGVTAPNRGIQVLSCIPGTGAAEALRLNDVILEWDGHTVDQLGFYEDPALGRLPFPYLISGHRRPGDTVEALVLRDGKEMMLAVRLARRDDERLLIPENVLNEPDEYLIEGGLILRELNARYLRAHGGTWARTVGTHIAQLYYTKQYAPDRPGQRVVVLAGVLPDAVNVGYQGFRNEIVTHVNGSPISRMADVFDVVDRDGGLVRLSLKSQGVDLVLSKEDLVAVNERLAREYGVPALRRQVAAPGAAAQEAE